MAKFRERVEAKITGWINSGKSDTEMLVFSEDYDRVRALLWSSRNARKGEKFSEEIVGLGKANLQALGKANYDNMLMMRDCCSGCGETYRLENLSICVDCDCTFCYRCTGKHCGCGGELVG
jgi:hypothetical protein